MAEFGKLSRKNLSQCVPDLQRLFNKVIELYDCSILCGRRGKEAQDAAFHSGASKVEWPNSKHNAVEPDLSKAVDVMPYPVNWTDSKRMYHFVGFVLATAAHMGIKVRSGSDWDGDLNFKDQNFHDVPHWEIIE